MSKIICDVCGTSYPETANQCPICGCVRAAEAKPVVNEDSDETAPVSYTYVKGGRFSRKNVKKRSQETGSVSVDPLTETEVENQTNSVDKGLTVGIVVLILAIVAVSLYIALRFFGPSVDLQPNETQQTLPTKTESTAQTTEATEETDIEISCDEIKLSKTAIKFDQKDAVLLLDVTVKPVDTTDVVTFSSSDDNVATVNEDGKITAVGSGEAVITVTCGSITAECTVICDIPEETEATTEATTVPTAAIDEFSLNREDFTMNSKGEIWNLYTGSINAEEIYWKSDDETVVTVKDGVVTAVGKGYTTVTAEYNGTKYSCVVRCADSVGAYQEPVTEEGTEETTATELPYIISASDVTIVVGEVFTLTLTDSQGNEVDASWSAVNSEVCTVEGNFVTGVASGMTTVNATVDGNLYSCIVRVK